MYYVYSHNDLDGIGCGILAKLAFGENVEVRYLAIGAVNHQVKRYLEEAKQEDTLFITDVSVDEENEVRIQDFLQKGGKAVTLLDHHKTALHLNKYTWASVQVEREDGTLWCATALLYDFLVHNHLLEATPSLNAFVELVRQYDTWEWEKNQNVTAKQLNDLLFLLSIEEFEEKMVERLKSSDSFTFDSFEAKLLELEQEKIKRYIRKKKRELVQLHIDDYITGVVHAESYHSELGNELGKEYEHLDYIALMNLGGKKLSLRTIHDHVDVSAIASTFGGGGHVKAAGCTLTEEVYRIYVEQAFSHPSIKEDHTKNTYNIKKSEAGSLYQNHDNELFFIQPKDGLWVLSHSDPASEKEFSSFEEAERFIKRQHLAWLANDQSYTVFVNQQLS